MGIRSSLGPHRMVNEQVERGVIGREIEAMPYAAVGRS